MNFDRMRQLGILLLSSIFVVLLAPGGFTQAAQPDTTPTTAAQSGTPVTKSCPFGDVIDGLDRGFYVENFPGNRLDTVTIRYNADDAGTFSVEMIAREGTYGGPVIGTATITFTYDTEEGDVTKTFDFGGAVVNSSTITFEQVVLSAPTSGFYYDVGTGTIASPTGPCPDFTQTAGTTPPLDSFRRTTAGVTIKGRQVDDSSSSAQRDCQAKLSHPDLAAGGRFIADAQLYWAPSAGKTVPGEVIAAGNTARVLGLDESGEFRQILWVCQKLWVRADTMQPLDDNVWNGAPLPTVVVE